MAPYRARREHKKMEGWLSNLGFGLLKPMIDEQQHQKPRFRGFCFG